MIARPPRTRTLPPRRRRSRTPPLRGYFPGHEKTRKATFSDRQSTETSVSLKGKHPISTRQWGGPIEYAKTATRNTEHEAHNRKTLTDYCAAQETAVWGGMTTSKHGVMPLPSTVSCSCGSTSGCSAPTCCIAHARREPLNFRPRIQFSCWVISLYFLNVTLFIIFKRNRFIKNF